MQDALHISPEHWGWVGTTFLVGYALFEIPTGHLGDTLGARRVLTRIVLWWSLFTAFTGATSAFGLLLVVRFLFGAGEAGAFPNASVAIFNWFPLASRGRALGLFIMCTQIGGAISPLLVVPIQQHFGWRMAFFSFAILGAIWSAVWFWKYRDHSTPAVARPPTTVQSWRPLFTSRTLWMIMALTFGYVYTGTFFQVWLHTYLVRGRGFTEDLLYLSALPYIFGAAGNLLGGFSCDWLTTRVGVVWSRRMVGVTGMLVAASFLLLSMFVSTPIAIALCLSFAYSGITFQQPAVFTACLDIGGARGGIVTGFMNTAGQVGGAVSSAVFGYVVKAYGSYNAPLVPMTVLLLLSLGLWFRVDVGQRIVDAAEEQTEASVYT